MGWHVRALWLGLVLSLRLVAAGPCESGYATLRPRLAAQLARHHIVFSGPPGAGKTTQGKHLARILGIPHISTGDLLRAEVKAGTELGREADAYMSKGLIIPDDSATMDKFFLLIQKRLAMPDCERGFIIDGFPRTVREAQMLEALLARIGKKLDAVFSFQVEARDLRERLAKRGRSDDKPEVVEERLRVYQLETAPVATYFAKRGLLHPIDRPSRSGHRR
jgi:adenylate kinase